MDMDNLVPLTPKMFAKRHGSKTLYRSICVPSTVQAYSLCIEYMKNWFLSKFAPDTFKSIYVEGKNIYDDFRTLSSRELLKKQKPALAITPTIDWNFNDEHIDSYPYGMDLYTQSGRFKESFFSCDETNSHLGIGLETILMEFNFRIRLETRAQQLDMFKLIKMACRFGFSSGEDVDLDFHMPYALMLQLAKDNGFEIVKKDTPDGQEERVNDVPSFLHWLNMHSALPFLYKHRALNGKNEFFLRLRNMYVHVKPSNLTADDGEREGQMTNNFTIEFSAEVRFPAPKMYAYYSENEHHLQMVYGAWYQPNGPVSTIYAFKATPIPDKNKYGWPLLLNTTYEEDEDKVGQQLIIEFKDLLQGDIGRCIHSCLMNGLSPSIFCDMIFYNGGEYVDGKIDWETLTFTSKESIRSAGTYIGIYVNNDYVSNFILDETGKDDRLKKSKK